MIRYSFFFFLLLFAACARQGAPTGGPKDTTPPKVDSIASTPNYATRFDRKIIELYFDEWVTLSDVPTQVVMSPPLLTKRGPDVKLKGKSVVVELPEQEVLRPNTTYTINFGTAVKDLHEGNPAKDLRFVFSTGDYIDSLTVRGSVADAFKLEPVENVTVMLYDEISDSILRKSKPYYFARTDKRGLFTIPNVRAGQFKVVALDDKDQNLLWNGSDERLAYLDSVLVMGDSLRPAKPLALRLFTDQPALRLKDKLSRNFGRVKLTYNSVPDSVIFGSDPPDVKVLREIEGDTMFIWYDRVQDSTAWNLLPGGDTIIVKSTTRAAFLRNHRVIWGDEAATAQAASRRNNNRGATSPTAAAAGPLPPKTVSHHPARPVALPFNFPITAFDTSRWKIMVDSVQVGVFSVAPDTLQPRNLTLRLDWKPEKNYLLTLLPGAITDLWGVANTDTLRRRFTILSDKQLGDLALTIKDLLPQKRYVLQLFNGTTLEIQRTFTAEAEQQKLTFPQLPAATYSARLIEDRNGNRRWDSGNYFAHRQPERIFEKKMPALRANWEVEATMQAGENVAEEKSRKL